MLYTANSISFCVGHWKFVLQFFMGAIDAKSILWKGINWHVEQIRDIRVALNWGGSLLITLSFILSWFAKHPLAWIPTLFELYGIGCSVLLTAALLSLRSLLSSNRDVQQSHKMMLIHLLIFNFFSVTLAVNQIVLWGYILGIFDFT